MKLFSIMINRLFIVFALLMANGVSAKTTYFVNDHLGSVVAALDEQGEVLYREGYYPFGERMIKEENEHSQWFTGKRHDEELGLSYYGARWYDPVVGRFTGIDAVEASEENIHSINRYGYSNNNPYLFIDPDGNSPFDIRNPRGNFNPNQLIDAGYGPGISASGKLFGNGRFYDNRSWSQISKENFKQKNKFYSDKLNKKNADLPARDSTGKAHGKLPKPKDLKKYSKEDLGQLVSDLRLSVQERIRKSTELGRDKPHGQRQGAEQRLIKIIDKILN